MDGWMDDCGELITFLGLSDLRSKSLNGPIVVNPSVSTTSSGSPSQPPVNTKSIEEEKENTKAKPSTTDNKQMEQTNGQSESKVGKSSSVDGKANSVVGPESAVGSGWKSSVAFAARDPKARARSREYLKQ